MCRVTRQHSLDAYRGLISSGKVIGIRAVICLWLHEHGASTRNEIDAALGGGRPNPPHSRRLSEMRALGILHVVGERDGSDLWDVTEKVPSEPTLPKSVRRASPARVLAEISELLRSPKAKVLPDATIDQALSVIDGAGALT